MRKTVLALWIFAIYIIQNVFGNVISVFGVVPDLFIAFTTVYAFMTRRFRPVAYVTVICAVLSGCGTGRVFAAVVLLTGVTGMISYTACAYMRFIPSVVRVQCVGFVMAFVLGCAEHFFMYHSLGFSAVLTGVLPHAVYTDIAVVIIYLILQQTALQNEEKQILMIREKDYLNEGQ